ncbi:hypothetical protein [Paraburkholderia kururiensis]|uniref:hypothetical protein n=1 Tax=Paraburkholderia kururiensis TaxID=984307 RepID=UPI0012E01346|nr:hypothetical protein [Paraburkholderia kururiensis]
MCSDVRDEFADFVSMLPLHDGKAMQCDRPDGVDRHACCLKKYGRRSAKPSRHEGVLS